MRTGSRTPFAVLIAVIAVLGLTVAAPLAGAQTTPTDKTYGGPKQALNLVAAGDDTPGDNPGAAGEESQGLDQEVVNGLPFTGIDVLALVAVAAALTSAGLVLRWMTARRDPTA